MLEATQMIAITLQAQEWQAVLGILNDGPYRIVASLIQKIAGQAEAADPAVTQLVPAEPRPLVNGGSDARRE